MQRNSKWSLCGDRDETIDHMMSKCSKLVRKGYQTRHVWVGKVINWEVCKKLKLGHTTKWYMQKPVCIQETETLKILWDFDDKNR